MMHSLGQQAQYERRLDDAHRDSLTSHFAAFAAREPEIDDNASVAGSVASSASTLRTAPKDPGLHKKMIKERAKVLMKDQIEEEAAAARRRARKAEQKAAEEAANERRAEMESRFKDTIQATKHVRDRDGF